MNSVIEGSNNSEGDQGEETKIEIKFPSAEIILGVLQKEYDYESDRKTRLETRAGILMTITMAILTFLITHVSMPKGIPVEANKELILFILVVITFLTSITLIIFALFNLINVFLVDEYERVDFESLDRELGRNEKDVIAMAIAEGYKSAISHNHKKNSAKTKKYKNGTTCVIGSIVTITLTIFLLTII